jgi:ABC-type dipeptide/oligopeptide/nickel transport system permease component
MIIWRGLGILTPIIPFLIFTLFSMLVGIFSMLLGDRLLDTYSSILFNISLSIILFVSSVLTWIMGRKLNANSIKMLLNPETNQQYILRKEHSLFFIKMEY